MNESPLDRERRNACRQAARIRQFYESQGQAVNVSAIQQTLTNAAGNSFRTWTVRIETPVRWG